jgi:ankyrin repeat protein
VLNLSELKFHDSLKLLSGHNVNYQTNMLVCLERDETDIKAEVFEKILAYIHANRLLLNRNDVPSLERLKNRANGIDNTQHFKSLKAYLQLAIRTEQAVSNVQGLNQKEKYVGACQAIPPHNASQLVYNLQLVYDNFPRYQLGNDLSVWNSGSGALPRQTDRMIILNQLRKLSQTYLARDTHSEEIEITCHRLVEWAVEHLKPFTTVKLAIVIGDETDNGAMLINANNAVVDAMPLIISKELLVRYQNEFKKNTPALNFFIQENGKLVLILPKNNNPKDLGFDCSQTKKWLGEPLDNDLNATNLPSDLNQIFLNDPSCDFFRLIAMFGHGSYPTSLSSSGLVLGCSTHLIQNVLKVLKDKNVLFMYAESCYSGGVNSAHIEMPGQGGVPFPIMIGSASDHVSFSNDRLSPNSLLKRAKECLFANHLPMIKKPFRNLSQSDMQSIGQQSPVKNTADALFNLPLALFPSKAGDVSKKVICNSTTSYVDVDLQIKKNKSKHFILNYTFPGYSRIGVVYLISSPVLNLEIYNTSDKACSFAATGTTGHHIIKEVKVAKQEFSNIVLRTLNVFQWTEGEVKEPSTKVIAIANLKCLVNDKPQELENTVIYLGPKKRFVLYRIAKENKYHLDTYILKPSILYPKDMWFSHESKILDEVEAVYLMYESFFESQPTLQSLRQIAGGQYDLNTFYDGVDQYFWGNQPSQDAVLYRSLMNNEWVFHRPNGIGKVSSKQVTVSKSFYKIARQVSTDDELSRVILKNALSLAQRAEKNDEAEFLSNLLVTDLMQAIGERDLKKTKILCQTKTLECLNFQDSQGRSALHRAVESRFHSGVKHLCLKGCDVSKRDKKKKYPLIIALDINDKISLKYLLRSKVPTAQLEFAIYDSIEKSGLSVIKMLIKSFSEMTKNNDWIFFLRAIDTKRLDVLQYLCTLFDLTSLIDTTIEIDQTHIDGKKPLHLAIERGHFNMVKFLLKLKADPNAIIPINNRNALQVAVNLSEASQAINMVSLCINTIKNLDHQDSNGNTALHLALKMQHSDVALQLILKGARTDIANNAQVTSEFLIFQSGNQELIQELISRHMV